VWEAMNNQLPILVSQDDIREIVRESVRTELAETLPKLIKRATKKDYFTSKEVRELTGFSSRKLCYLRDEGKIDFVQHGKSVLYPTESLYEFLERHHVKLWGE
jgi:hypothetical protein